MTQNSNKTDKLNLDDREDIRHFHQINHEFKYEYEDEYDDTYDSNVNGLDNYESEMPIK
jgi:hypothetical protein